MNAESTIKIIFYTREDCHLCELALDDLQSLQEEFPIELIKIDVDSTIELQREYGFEVPVVVIGPYTLRAPFTLQELRMSIGAAQDRQRHIDMIEKEAVGTARPGEVWTSADKFTHWISKHYMAFFNLLVAIYLGLPFLAPVLMKAGINSPANVLYRVYGAVCHQLSYRSFFLFGEQIVYPRAAVEFEGYLTYEQATGNGEGSSVDEIFTARLYVGDEKVGYKVALCERDIAIYAGILLFGLVFSVTGRRLGTFPWYLWLLVGVAPIGLDGFSQLLSQPPFNFFPFRESSPYLRVLTGALFGFATAWFGYPLVEETMVETRKLMGDKRKRTLAKDK